MSDNEREAVRLFGAYTAGSYLFWVLSGPTKASCRAHVLSTLHGRKVPIREAGLTALREALTPLAPGTADACRAEAESRFGEWARGL